MINKIFTYFFLVKILLLIILFIGVSNLLSLNIFAYCIETEDPAIFEENYYYKVSDSELMYLSKDKLEGIWLPAEPSVCGSKGIELEDPTATVSEWIFEKKLILSYLLTNKEAFTKLKNDLGLTEKQIEEISTLVKEEAEKIFFLCKKSQAIAEDMFLSLEERKKAIEDLKYNERISEIIKESVQRLKEIFKDQEKYAHFTKWIEEEWLEEHEKHME
jgi:hypothetical protein